VGHRRRPDHRGVAAHARRHEQPPRLPKAGVPRRRPTTL
jgi:hypothetical protein